MTSKSTRTAAASSPSWSRRQAHLDDHNYGMNRYDLLADNGARTTPPAPTPRRRSNRRARKLAATTTRAATLVTTEASQTPVAPTQLYSPPENKRKEPESNEHVGNGDVSKPLPQLPSTIDEARQLGWTEFDAGGDGDCFFKAFVHGDATARKLPADAKSTEREACKLRVAAVTHMKDPKHYNGFKSFYQQEDMAALYQEVNQTAPKDFDDFLKLCAGKGCWANQLIIKAVSERTGVPIVIWNAASKKVDSDFYKLPKEEQQRQGRPRTQRVWHRGVVAPRFQDDFAVSKVNYTGVALVLRNNHDVCLLPPQHDCEIPRMWLRETNSLFPQVGGAGETNTPAKLRREPWKGVVGAPVHQVLRRGSPLLILRHAGGLPLQTLVRAGPLHHQDGEQGLLRLRLQDPRTIGGVWRHPLRTTTKVAARENYMTRCKAGARSAAAVQSFSSL